jgi:hypothetical protein
MSSRTLQDNNDNQDDQDSEGTQRPSRQTRTRTASIDPPSDDEDSYEPSNDDNHEDNLDDTHEDTAAFGDATEIINALDYVAADHPLRPARKSLVLDHPRTLHRFRNHSEFWWEVLLAMQKRAKINQSRSTDQTLRDETLRLADQVQELRRERTLALSQKDAAEVKTVHLNREVEKLKKERDRDQAMIAHLSSRPRTAEARIPERIDDSPLHETAETPGVNTTRRTTTRHPSTLPEEPHNNPKFPDAPIFSGDRATFDSWKDKVYDKLHNSFAQYPTDYHQIAYVKSRTEGGAYQQIRAQCQPGHTRAFQTADEVLNALEKVYGDRNKRARAIDEMRTLKMGRRPFDDFYTDFARCAAEIGYADDALIPLLGNAISDELVGKVIGLQKPSDYYDLVDFYREIDHQMREHDRRVSNRLRTPRSTSSTDQTKASRPTPGGTFRPEGYRPNPAERALLAQHGRCYKCGEHGHRIGDCTKPQMKEMPRLSARSTSKLNKATVDSDDETVVEGKELS